ncbi:MAG: nucleotidyltransferase domain-containing protein [Candidatus Edwardsbacteria bacterium]
MTRRFTLNNRLQSIIKRMFLYVRKFYGSRLISLVVFGSVARGTETFDSDIDILIVAKGLPKGRTKRIKEFGIVEDKMEPFLKFFQREGINTCISAIIKSPEEANKGSPLFLDMVDDAKIIFDRNKFFLTILQRLRNKLRILGAKRIWMGNVWYWDLKPDYKPGDTIEL